MIDPQEIFCETFALFLMIGFTNSGDVPASENNQKGFAQTVPALAGTLQLESVSVDMVLLWVIERTDLTYFCRKSLFTT